MKHRSMTVLRAGMLLLSAALFGALVWLLWQTACGPGTSGGR